MAMWFQPGGVPGRKAAAANLFRKKKDGKGNAGAGARNAGGAADAAATSSVAAEATTAADDLAAADIGIKDVLPGLHLRSHGGVRSHLGHQQPTATLTATTANDAATTTTAANNTIATGKDNNVKDATDTIPRPLANNAAFWPPPPNSTCRLFT
ncbi:hypothetical protein EXIGLDRAFT_767671 [Exidia glandulosa HHB12029]|uniref:Uncharacterized protein n=1 Tax=Exidia glandulosa HHB12029 TaxID=1314781 RepID=A0A165IV07_EXIGL|nr:hypothetical protein EXIGLDRAFT_767671 [Exidia glandulosa HHB12029]